MRAKLGRDPTAVSKKVPFNFISRCGGPTKMNKTCTPMIKWNDPTCQRIPTYITRHGQRGSFGDTLQINRRLYSAQTIRLSEADIGKVYCMSYGSATKTNQHVTSCVYLNVTDMRRRLLQMAPSIGWIWRLAPARPSS